MATPTRPPLDGLKKRLDRSRTEKARLPRDGFLPTTGPVNLDHCRAYWHGFHRLGLAAAPLHCGAWSPHSSDLERFLGTSAPSIAIRDALGFEGRDDTVARQPGPAQ